MVVRPGLSCFMGPAGTVLTPKTANVLSTDLDVVHSGKQLLRISQIPINIFPVFPTGYLTTEWAQVEVIDLINDGSGLAFGIIGGRSTGVVVKTILPGGVADRDGRLQSGDHILQIGEVNLRGLGSEQVAAVLRQCGVHVRMVVARPVESANADFQTLGSHAPVVPTKILGDPVELDRHLIENGYAEAFAPHPPVPYTPYIYTGQHTDLQLHPISGMVDVVKDPLPIGAVPIPVVVPPPTNTPKMLPLDAALREPDLPETEIYTVELKKDDLGLGITVAGYVCEKEEISGIFVKSISKGSAADLTNNIKVNDRIIEVDGISVIGFTNHQAVEQLRNTGPMVKIKVERYLRGPKYEKLQQAIRANELRPPSPPSPSASSLPKVPLSLVHMSHLGIEPEGESRTSFDFDSTVLMEAEDREIVIGGQDGCTKSLQFSISSHDIVYEKWREKMPEDVEIVIAQMYKEDNHGLGISLEGTVDVEDGKEVRPHHYIRNILPDGPVGKSGILQSGDELLEVNSIQLLGLNHIEVVAILKQLPNYVSLVCARYRVPIRVIDTSQHLEAFQARKILAGSLQTLIPIGLADDLNQPQQHGRLVKAKSETSIASVSLGSEACTLSRSRSLELIEGLPMWSEEHVVVELNKGDHGLGFSILDYQDPLNTQETVIVIRSLVPGGVAQCDGRLIPGDRLIAVNDVNVEHATLDAAVQVLKGAPKGKVKIAVAKPINCQGDAVSQASQDTEEDHTCLEDFQECIEEFQECLDAIHICIDEDNSFNHSSCNSQVEDLGQKTPTRAQNSILSNHSDHFLLFETSPTQNNRLKVNGRDSIGDSDIDISFKSTNDNSLDNKIVSATREINSNIVTSENFVKTDSVQSDILPTSTSEKDEYETCLSDVSITEDNKLKTNQKNLSLPTETELESKVQITQSNNDDQTPTNETTVTPNQIFVDTPPANSAPCIHNSKPFDHNLDTKIDDELKSYDNHDSTEDACGDEFFLVQYPPEEHPQEVSKSASEPNVLETYELPVISNTFAYRRCLKEYYNDYQDCLESYKIECKDEMSDDEVFSDILLPFKSKSAPNVMDSSFVTLTYDPGPDLGRRKSAFVPGYENVHESEMTVIRHIDTDYGTMKGYNTDDMLQKHWGSTQTVKVFREVNKSIGISIVGGKVDLLPSEKSSDILLGIFVKNVVPNSPAGKTGKFKTGDRILEVSGIDLRQASHDKAVQAIRTASNPVTFVIQSLIPWADSDRDSNIIENEKHSDDTYASPIKKQKIPPPAPSSNKVAFKNETVDIAPKLQIIPPSVSKNDLPTKNESTSTPNQNDYQKNDRSETPDVSENKRVFSESDSEEDEDEEDVRELEGRTVSAKGEQIDRASAANIKRNKEEIAADPEQEDDFGYTTNKVKKKYNSLGNTILMVQLERGSQGLGLSLAGHKDRNCMAVFVCGLNPNGAAHKTGAIQIGDEILEVNGVVLHGRCHLNASAIIKGLSGPIFKVIILRRKTAIDDIAVKPITQFPVSLAEEASEEQFSATYPNVRTVAVKKANQSLGIMIIEGKHADVGQGIFISDIQEASSAEKAGLEIGEMILAVNKDSLVGSNYDTAASLLKRTEGLVTLVVSNPGKKDVAPSPVPGGQANNVTAKSGLKPGAQPSRPTTPVPEPPADPLTCPVIPGKDTVIEINTDNKALGIFFVGGKDTPVSNGIVIVELYSGGVAEKDGRLQPGDQILDVNGTSLKEATYTTAAQALRQTLPKTKLTVSRPAKIEYSPIEVDLLKKPGKGLGLSVIARKAGKGVYVADILSGGTADLDGKVYRGDLLISVNGQNVENATGEEAGAMLKTVMGKVSLKLHRYNPPKR